MAAQSKSKNRKGPAKGKSRPATRRGSAAKARKPAPRPKAKTRRTKPPARGSAKGPAKKSTGGREAASARKEAARKKALALKEKQQALARKDAERKKALADRERKRKLAEKERANKQAKREREQAATRKAAERKEKEAARKKALAEKEREAKKKAAEKERARQKALDERKKALARKEAERAKAVAEKEREAKKKAAEKERLQLAKEREADALAKQKAREEERSRQKAEREAARANEKAEREAERERVREEARRRKEEEKAKRDAEREAYRKAKEGEQARLRAEREAARRALEGRVVRATRASRAAAGGRLASSTRVYTPSSIPDQSRTRRSAEEEGGIDPRFANLRVPSVTGKVDESRPIPRTIPPPPAPPPAATVEERYAKINERLAQTDDAFRSEYEESLLMSWIYHDSALEGVVYTYEELRMAINPSIAVVPDSSLQSVCDEIRRHKAAIEFVKEQAEKKRVPLTMDTVKRIYLILHPEEGDLKTVKYRKDIPQHRLYFHEYAAPDKIAYKVRQVFDWLNGPEPKKIRNAVRIAARVHYDLLRVFPFALDSGKVIRLFTNLMLMRADCPPAIIHSTERQKYYEALRGQLPIVTSMVTEAITNALGSIEKKLDERDSRLRTFA